MKKDFFVPFLVIAAFFVSAIARGQEEVGRSSTFPQPAKATRNEWKPHIGLLGGISNPEGNYNTNGEFGIDAGFQPYIPFGAGVELTRAELDAKEGGENIERTTVLFRGTYNFGGENTIVKYSYIGVGLGVVFKPNATDVASAPIIGFDIPLNGETDQYTLSLGANAKYLIVSGSDPDTLGINGVVKYWY